MIKYLGSKRLLVPKIVDLIRAVPGTRTVVDLFSGTSRVGHALKRAGYRVLANDHNAYAETLARCYVEADREDVLAEAGRLLPELNRLPGKAGWFTETYCVRSRYFHPRNGARIEEIRNAIERMAPPAELRAVLLVSLLEAADRVDSTVGLQMAYLKQWAARALVDLELRVPDVLPRALAGKGQAHGLDAIEAAGALEGDVAYLDPPYNQHSFLGNYHVWESLVRWDRPEVYGIACKRVDCRERKSDFNSRPRIEAALRAVVEAVRAPVVVLSFNDEGYISPEQVGRILTARGEVRSASVSFRRYVGAKIGIYNPKGEKVGTPGKLRNREHIFVAAPPGHPALDAVARVEDGAEPALFDLR